MLFAAPPDLTNVTPTYKCANPAAPDICYATDPKTDQLFKSIQASINKYTGSVGFSPIGVDGKIGSKTAVALQKVVQWLLMNPATAAIGSTLVAPSRSYTTLAASAVLVAKQLEIGATYLQLKPVPAPKPGTPVTPAEPPPGLPPSPGMGRQIPWKWILGGIAVLGIGYFAFLRKPARGRRAMVAAR